MGANERKSRQAGGWPEPRHEPLPEAEVIGSLPAWSDEALRRLAVALAPELGRRKLPMPAALPVVEATEAWGHGSGFGAQHSES